MSAWARCDLCAGWGCSVCGDSGVVRVGRDWTLFWSVWRGWALGSIVGLVALGVAAWLHPL